MTFDGLGGGMQWRKPFVKLRSEQREGGDAADGRDVAGARVVADEERGIIEQLKERGDAAGTGRIFAALLPPAELLRVTGDLHVVIFFAQPGGE